MYSVTTDKAKWHWIFRCYSTNWFAKTIRRLSCRNQTVALFLHTNHTQAAHLCRGFTRLIAQMKWHVACMMSVSVICIFSTSASFFYMLASLTLNWTKEKMKKKECEESSLATLLCTVRPLSGSLDRDRQRLTLCLQPKN